MKNKNIDIDIITQLLKQVPDNAEVTSIDFTNNTYRVHLAIDYDNHKEDIYHESINNLLELIQKVNYSEIEKQGEEPENS